jgi:hypothetical protein
MEFAGSAIPLSSQSLDEACDVLKVVPAAIWAVLAVETHGCGFLQDRRPTILFERHIFHRETDGMHSFNNPSISSSKPGGYMGGAAEYDRLRKAITLDRRAALNSASWGIGQIMGFNAGIAGFDSAEAMVTAMVQTEDFQLRAVVNFLKSQELDKPMARRDWTSFARGYNGRDYADNHYDTRLEASFAQFVNGGLPDITVRQAQVLLTLVGINPGKIDGIVGKRTRSAIAQFKEESGLTGPDMVDHLLISELFARLQSSGRTAAAGAGSLR